MIGLGTITHRRSQLVADGNDVETKYTMHLDTLLKGMVPANGDVAFWSMGGCIAFPDGTTVEHSTVLWRYLEVGKRYLVFFSKGEGTTLLLSGGMEGVGRLTSPSGEFEIAAHLDKAKHHIISDRPKGMTLLDLVNKIKLAH